MLPMGEGTLWCVRTRQFPDEVAAQLRLCLAQVKRSTVGFWCSQGLQLRVHYDCGLQAVGCGLQAVITTKLVIRCARAGPDATIARGRLIIHAGQGAHFGTLATSHVTGDAAVVIGTGNCESHRTTHLRKNQKTENFITDSPTNVEITTRRRDHYATTAQVQLVPSSRRM